MYVHSMYIGGTYMHVLMSNYKLYVECQKCRLFASYPDSYPAGLGAYRRCWVIWGVYAKHEKLVAANFVSSDKN
jgi:hypothetical protein